MSTKTEQLPTSWQSHSTLVVSKHNGQNHFQQLHMQQRTAINLGKFQYTRERVKLNQKPEKYLLRTIGGGITPHMFTTRCRDRRHGWSYRVRVFITTWGPVFNWNYVATIWWILIYLVHVSNTILNSHIP